MDILGFVLLEIGCGRATHWGRGELGRSGPIYTLSSHRQSVNNHIDGVFHVLDSFLRDGKRARDSIPLDGWIIWLCLESDVEMAHLRRDAPRPAIKS